MKAHCLLIQLYMTPRPHLHRCNMTPLPPSILACGGDSMNFYHAAGVCRSVCLLLLIFFTISETRKCISSCQRARRFLLRVFDSSFLKSEQICIANFHILRVRLFFFFFFVLMIIPTGMCEAVFQPSCLATVSVDGHEMFCASEILDHGR